MELYVLLEFLKFLWLGIDIIHYVRFRKRGQALILRVEIQDQRLSKLESQLKKYLE